MANAIQAQSVSFMTYNIRLDVASDGINAWPNRKDWLAAQVRFYQPAVLGIQEALPHQVSDLTERLPDYQHIGLFRDGNGKGEASNVFFLKARFALLDSGTFWLSATPDTVSRGWDAACNRVCTYALLRDKTTKKIFWVFNTHFDHIGETARINSVSLILEKIKTLNIKNYPVIFMGDLNSEPGSAVVTALSQHLTDTRTLVQQPFGPTGTFNAFQFGQPVTHRIDYIFVSNPAQVAVIQHATLSDCDQLRYPSDHLPVLTILKFL